MPGLFPNREAVIWLVGALATGLHPVATSSLTISLTASDCRTSVAVGIHPFIHRDAMQASILGILLAGKDFPDLGIEDLFV